MVKQMDSFQAKEIYVLNDVQLSMIAMGWIGVRKIRSEEISAVMKTFELRMWKSGYIIRNRTES